MITSFNWGTPLNYGRRSKVFDIGNNKVVKLYDKSFPKQKITREFENTFAVVNQTTLPVPKPFEVVTIQEQTGIVFEKIEGISYMDTFQKKPWEYFTKSSTLANVHKKIHLYKVTGLLSQQEIFESILQNSERLLASEKEFLIDILNHPRTVKLCHGDFHHGNLLLTKASEIFILDWMDAFTGDPILDVALTAVNASISDMPAHIPALYYYLYELVKKVVPLDNIILSKYQIEDSEYLDRQLLLAAGIHLVRKDDGSYVGHRRYFDALIEHAFSKNKNFRVLQN